MSGLSGVYAVTSVEDAKTESPYWIDGSVTDGPELQAALDKQVQAYVDGQGGNKFIRKVLVANNGIAATKGIRSIRKWSYETFGCEKAIQFLVMATPEDIRISAEYVKLADEFVEVSGGSNNMNYANVELIIDIAQRYNCDAVFAGWGHASENPKLPDSFAATNGKIAFMGPGAVAMAALGDKIASTLIAQSVDVPCVPWSGSGIKVDFKSKGEVDDKAFADATVTTFEEAMELVPNIGFPIMVKASEGGGGKGIRVVTEMKNMETAFRQVAGEIPGSPIFLMKMMSGARHLEVQLIADKYGEAIALNGRDCSVQRRCQKIIEEGPQVVAPPETWTKMEQSAVALAKEVGYCSAGTVEYLYVPSLDEYYFLELNPRLQVEHPCSEWITGCNIPALQLQIAMGLPLSNIPDIRKFYGKPRFDPAVKPDFSVDKPKIHGHVIAGRITAENPDEGFQPTSGSITELTFRNTPNVWGYFSTYSGVHEFADSQFGHLFAWGANREAARRNMICALKELNIRGDIRTTVEYLITLMEKPDFRSNDISTQWLDGLIAKKVKAAKPDVTLSTICGALYKAYAKEQTYLKDITNCLEKGQMPPQVDSFISFDTELILDDVKYSYQVQRRSKTLFQVSIHGSSVFVEMRPLNDGGLHICINGHSHMAYGKEESSMLRLIVDGKTVVFSKEYDPTQIDSVMAGKLVRNLVPNGGHVNKGDEIFEVEVMKMFLSLRAPESGTIQNLKLEGSVLDVGDLIATMTLDDPSKVKKATIFDGQLPEMSLPVVHGAKLHQVFRAEFEKLNNVLTGYGSMPVPYANAKYSEALTVMMKCALNPELGAYEISECLATISARIPKQLREKLSGLLDAAKGQPTIDYKPFQLAIEESLSSIEAAGVDALKMTLAPMQDILVKYVDGPVGVLHKTCTNLLESYCAVEKHFQRARSSGIEEMIFLLREVTSSDPAAILAHLVSHANLSSKNVLAKQLMQILDEKCTAEMESLTDLLADMATWQAPQTVSISRLAREILVKHRGMSIERMTSEVDLALKTIAASPAAEQDALLNDLINNVDYMSSVILHFVFNPDAKVQLTAIKSYIRRIYKAYLVSNESELAATVPGVCATAQWTFKLGNDEEVRATSPMRNLKRVDSLESFLSEKPASADDTNPLRLSQIVVLDDVSVLKGALPAVLEQYQTSTKQLNLSKPGFPINTLSFFTRDNANTAEEETVANIRATLAASKDALRGCLIRSVTVVVMKSDLSHRFFTFPASMEFDENPIHRHIDPALAYQLELERLKDFTLQRHPTKCDSTHVFYATHESDNRFFARSLIRSTEMLTSSNGLAMPDAERAFAEALTVIEDAMTSDSAEYDKSDMNHIFLNLLQTVQAPPDVTVDDLLADFLAIFRRIYVSHAAQMDKIRVTDVEIRVSISAPATGVTPLRLCLSNPTGHNLQVHAYKETHDESSGNLILSATGLAAGLTAGPLDGNPRDAPYTTLDRMQQKRLRAAQLGTTYAYDYADLFMKALKTAWKTEAETRRLKGLKLVLPQTYLKTTELHLDGDGNLVEVNREAGTNRVGKLVWRYTIYTPEYPSGRELIVIADDITVGAGAFGPSESKIFNAASKLARSLGLPRIYLAANSGARIGMAEEVKACYQVAWVDPSDPAKGFKYLYLSPEDHARLVRSESGAYKKAGVGSKSVNAVQITDEGEERWQIVDIIGEQDGLNQECLAGSGTIAGETSRAYDEIFTLTYVTSRSVGIGAYLVRLGQRVIQKKTNSPIILTGFGALNKVLGRPVYLSNAQLGGIRVMHANGVSHMTVDDDLEGVTEILKWVSYVPSVAGSPLPSLESADPISRKIDFMPTKSPYNVRDMLAGVDGPSGWISGFFDQNSWTETLDGWAKNVVTGRARLGGLPVGIIAVETRTVDRLLPADPADPDTKEVVQPQAGQVWFPDSSYKTANAISDFNREGLPLMIFANWRGFSGGARDMFDEILKFGSYIVDELVAYKQPVQVYIPPHGELRGGAWVVVDPNINSEVMEMYADSRSSGGVLEADGTISVKYRKPHMVKTMHRMDEQLIQLGKELQDVQNKEGANSPAAGAVSAKIAARERELLPIYTQLATRFAELHDTPGRQYSWRIARTIVLAYDE
eukprot:SAG31_NODE_163_length_21856_cov_7.550214_1_plen_2125_part_00